jgi:hypothetical protein
MVTKRRRCSEIEPQNLTTDSTDVGTVFYLPLRDAERVEGAPALNLNSHLKLALREARSRALRKFLPNCPDK